MTDTNQEQKQLKTQQELIKTILRQMPPQLAFWAGVITAAAALFAVGFVILLVLMVKGVDLGAVTTKGSTTTNSARTNTNAVAKATSIDMDTLSHIRGSGDVTVVEFSDLECPYCKKFHATMLQVAEKYDGKVRWAYKHFPLKIHSKAPREAEATECASEQGKFWEYIDKIFERTPSNNKLEDSELYTIADELGLDRTKFDECLASEKYASLVTTDANQAQALGATGTPFVQVVDNNGKVIANIPGALPITAAEGKSSMTTVLDQVLQ